MATAETLTKKATDEGFEKSVLSADGLKVVDFWAEWCGPCRVIGPAIDSLAQQYEGRAEVFKMNVDENPNTPAKFHIRGIPTILFFKNGQLVDQVVGAVPRESLQLVIEKHL